MKGSVLGRIRADRQDFEVAPLDEAAQLLGARDGHSAVPFVAEKVSLPRLESSPVPISSVIDAGDKKVPRYIVVTARLDTELGSCTAFVFCNGREAYLGFLEMLRSGALLRLTRERGPKNWKQRTRSVPCTVRIDRFC